jgi:hypothetical protein
MLDGLTLGHHLKPVDYTSRLLLAERAVISSEVTDIFDRLRTNSASGQARLKKLSEGRLFGRFFAASRETLRAVTPEMLDDQSSRVVQYLGSTSTCVKRNNRHVLAFRKEFM